MKVSRSSSPPGKILLIEGMDGGGGEEGSRRSRQDFQVTNLVGVEVGLVGRAAEMGRGAPGDLVCLYRTPRDSSRVDGVAVCAADLRVIISVSVRIREAFWRLGEQDLGASMT